MAHNDETPRAPRSVIIEEFYKEWHGKILRYWRFEGQSNWNTQKTPYKQLPYVLFTPVLEDNIRSKKTKEEFIKYMNDHPHERFWQSIKNFTKSDFVLTAEYAKFNESDSNVLELWTTPQDTYEREEK